VARYAESDKADPSLGTGVEGWPVPYWFGDAAFGVMAVLLGAVDAGLGACVLGAFRGEEALTDALGVPEGWRLFGAVVLGHPDPDGHRSGSLDRRPVPTRDRIHRGRW
jgi:nitroreductase